MLRSTVVAAFAFATALVFSGFASPSSSRAEDEDPVIRSLVEAERAFARLSVEKGMREAFLANLAEDAVIFRPGPVPAVPWYRDQPASKSVLEWAPEFAAVSSAGDLGYTSGPWTYRRETGGEPLTGHFVSVWRREPGGTWKVILDAGVQHEAKSGSRDLTYGPRSGDTGPNDGREAAEKALLAAERALAAASAENGWVEAFAARVTGDVRAFRTGDAPALGRDAARALYARRPGKLQWKTDAAVAASRGDLGFVYGTCERHVQGARPDSVDATAFLRIWRRRADGAYEIALDLASPMPAPKPAAASEAAASPVPQRKP
jgi:ketosteroid isomerase-like protein